MQPRNHSENTTQNADQKKTRNKYNGTILFNGLLYFRNKLEEKIWVDKETYALVDINTLSEDKKSSVKEVTYNAVLMKHKDLTQKVCVKKGTYEEVDFDSLSPTEKDSVELITNNMFYRRKQRDTSPMVWVTRDTLEIIDDPVKIAEPDKYNLQHIKKAYISTYRYQRKTRQSLSSSSDSDRNISTSMNDAQASNGSTKRTGDSVPIAVQPLTKRQRTTSTQQHVPRISLNKIKQEPITTRIQANEDRPILKLDLDDVRDVVYRLCSAGIAPEACTYYAKAIIDYFKTGKKPTEPVSADQTYSTEHFRFYPTYGDEPRKRERVVIKTDPTAKQKRRPSRVTRSNANIKMITESVVDRRSELGSLAPSGAVVGQHIDVDSGKVSEIYQVEDFRKKHYLYKQPGLDVDELDGALKKEAQKNPLGVSFGTVDLGRCGKNAEDIGHIFVYYATATEVIYIDCQSMEVTQTDDGPIFEGDSIIKKLRDEFVFSDSDNKAIDDDTYGRIVFYTKMGPAMPQQKNTFVANAQNAPINTTTSTTNGLTTTTTTTTTLTPHPITAIMPNNNASHAQTAARKRNIQPAEEPILLGNQLNIISLPTQISPSFYSPYSTLFASPAPMSKSQPVQTAISPMDAQLYSSDLLPLAQDQLFFPNVSEVNRKTQYTYTLVNRRTGAKIKSKYEDAVERNSWYQNRLTCAETGNFLLFNTLTNEIFMDPKTSPKGELTPYLELNTHVKVLFKEDLTENILEKLKEKNIKYVKCRYHYTMPTPQQ